MRWEVAPEFALEPDQVLAVPGETVKRATMTLVTRHRLAGRVFYVKRYLHGARPFSRLQYFVWAPKSRREWKYAPRLRHRGVPVVPHLAHGECWGWCGLLESTLITEGLPGYELLSTIGDPDAPELQCALGRFVRRMHDVGVVYLDIAPQNLVYARGEHKFCLIDVDKVAFLPAVDEQRRVAHLAVFHSRFSLTEAFYESYGGGIARRAAEIAERAKVIRAVTMTRLSRRCLKHAHEVVTRRIGGLKWHIHRAYLDETLEKILENPDAFLGTANGFVVQRFRSRSAKQAYREAYRRERLGEAALRPVAAVDKRVLGFVVRGYFVAKLP